MLFYSFDGEPTIPTLFYSFDGEQPLHFLRYSTVSMESKAYNSYVIL